MAPKIAAYGSWKSPISASLVAAGGMSSRGTLFDVFVDRAQVYWREQQADNDARYDLRSASEQGGWRSLLPTGYSVHSSVHEYGGGAFFVDDGVVFFSNAQDQRLYRLEPGQPPKPLSPEPDLAQGLRYADGRVRPDGSWLVTVQEAHRRQGLPQNQLVALNPKQLQAAKIIAGGHDFYANPRFDASGEKLLFLTWDHPNMPWDGTELWQAEFNDLGELGEPQRIAGGPQESIFQPEWGPDGSIYYISDETGWWNLYRTHQGQRHHLLAMEADFGAPAWNFGYARYAFLANDRLACLYTQMGVDKLGILDLGEGSLDPVELPFSAYYLPYLRSDGAHQLWFLASSPTQPQALYSYNIEDASLTQIHQPAQLDLSHDQISVGQPFEFPTSRNEQAYAFLYPPKNPEYAGPPDELPPLMVMIHGGPTSAAVPQFHLEKQFWTSRGYMVIDVNYRGSTGYGREYRDKLKGEWGVIDVEDCLRAARYLADKGHVDPARLVIRGSSAGGFVTLAALTQSDLFDAGASYYGVVDVEALAQFTHKFEAHYLDTMIGPYPEAADLYQQRSPINHTQGLSSPLIIFQGLDDKVVPPSQAHTLVEALEAKGLAYSYLEFKGESHGFNQDSTVVRALTGELYFYSKVLGHGLEEEVEPVEIKNFPD